MLIGTLELQLRLPSCRSLKDKRRILRGLLEKARQDFGVSMCEVGDHDMWGNALLGAAYVTTSSSMAESVLQKVVSLFDDHPEVEIEFEYRDLIRD